jgi:steroid 5-alpha reductase family enzyme
MMGPNDRVRSTFTSIEILRSGTYTGLWRYSRHPNYFFEQLFWWSLALFGTNVGAPWVFVGALFNSLCMVQVTRLTEERMMRRPERAGLYSSYMKRTSAWIPMPVLGKDERA